MLLQRIRENQIARACAANCLGAARGKIPTARVHISYGGKPVAHRKYIHQTPSAHPNQAKCLPPNAFGSSEIKHKRLSTPTPTSMSALRNIRLLIWRNCIKRSRAKCSSLCELLFPLFIVAIFILLFQAFSNDRKPDAQYLRDWAAVPTLAGQGFRALNTTSVIAIGTCTRQCSICVQ
jgi:hypothetical protein